MILKLSTWAATSFPLQGWAQMALWRPLPLALLRFPWTFGSIEPYSKLARATKKVTPAFLKQFGVWLLMESLTSTPSIQMVGRTRSKAKRAYFIISSINKFKFQGNRIHSTYATYNHPIFLLSSIEIELIAHPNHIKLASISQSLKNAYKLTLWYYDQLTTLYYIKDIWIIRWKRLPPMRLAKYEYSS